jgi:hypothetical protein
MTNNITENDYLELAEHSKEMYNKQNEIITKLREEIIELKKDIITGYTFFKLLDNLVDEFIEEERDDFIKHPLQILTELARSNFSEKVEYFLNN